MTRDEAVKKCYGMLNPECFVQALEALRLISFDPPKPSATKPSATEIIVIELEKAQRAYTKTDIPACDVVDEIVHALDVAGYRIVRRGT